MFKEKSIDDLVCLFRDTYGAVYALNDRGHREEHFHDVFTNALKIMEITGHQEDIHHVLTVAYVHDMFSWSRDNHHYLSAEFIRTTKNPMIAELAGSDREKVALACLEHRASWKGGLSTGLSELMSSADRGEPGNVDLMIERTILCRADIPGMTREKARDLGVAHLKEKFGRNGYCKFPGLYVRAYKDKLEEQWDKIDKL